MEKQNIKYYITQIVLLIFCLQAFSQKIKGNVTDNVGNPIFGATVSLDNTLYSVTNANGDFYFNATLKEFTLKVEYIGFNTYEKKQSLLKNEQIRITLQPKADKLKAVEVRAKTKAEILRETGYSVDVIETKKLKNLSRDLNQVLKTVSGISIRETGGLGSGFQLSLNGLSGNQVRYFMDDIPMESYGSSLSLNNFQVNLVKNIEVFKGVVPSNLGADALGGAINIVTPSKKQKNLDVSYSIGSFNTHRASLFGNYYNAKKGMYVRVMSFFNHSDNNYKMYNVPVFDLELGNEVGEVDIKRFHDQYTSKMLNFQLGVLDKKFADELTVSFLLSNNKKNYQHPDNNILRVFGNFHTKDQTAIANILYKKKINKMSLKAYINAGKTTQKTIDTSSYKYNWAKESIKREDTDIKGELYTARSLFVLDDLFLTSNIYGSYKINRSHKINVSVTHNYLKRQGEDKVNSANLSFESPNYVSKNISSIAYDFISKNKKLYTSVFGKQFMYSGKIITQDTEDNEVITKPNLFKYGYGGAISYKINESINTKISLEQAYRIPEPYELLGDGIYVRTNSNLQPEKSLNINLGAIFKTKVKTIDFRAETNIFHRNSNGFIRFSASGPFGQYENLQDVNSQGIEGSIYASYKNKISLTTNFTYQNITDQSPYDEGFVNSNYKSRLPNIPYLFGNARISIKPYKKITMHWNTRYVHDFFLKWESLGDPNNKHIIPQQIIHDIEASNTFYNDKFSVSLAVTNLFNSLAYDNFNIQKPGRAFTLKLRYSLGNK